MRPRQLIVHCCLLVAGAVIVYHATRFVSEVRRQPDWRFDSQLDTTWEELSELAKQGDLTELRKRLQQQDPLASSTAMALAGSAARNGHRRTATYLELQSKGLRWHPAQGTAQRDQLLEQIRSGRLLDMEQVAEIEDWLASGTLQRRLPSHAQTERLLGKGVELPEQQEGQMTLAYHLARSRSEGGGSGVSFRRSKTYRLELVFDQTRDELIDARIVRERRVDTDYQADF